MEQKAILICDLSQDDVRSTGFLLELAGYRVYSVRCLEEAVNWLSVYAEQAQTLSLVLVVGPWAEFKDSALLTALCQGQKKQVLVFDPGKKVKKVLYWEEGRMAGEDLSEVPVWSVVSMVRDIMGHAKVRH